MCTNVLRGSFVLFLLCPLPLQTLWGVNPSLTSLNSDSCSHPSYSAQTLRDSRSFPNGDSVWKEAKQTAVWVSRASFIPDQTIKQATWNTQRRHFFCLLLPFWERAEQAIMIIQAASLSLSPDVLEVTSCRLQARSDSSGSTCWDRMYIFRSRWSSLPRYTAAFFARHLIWQAGKYLYTVIAVVILSINSLTEGKYIHPRS